MIRGSNQAHKLLKDNKLLLLELLQHKNPAQKCTRTLYLWAEAEISLCIKNGILYSMTHSFACTFKEMFVSVTVYFKVECMIP